MPAPLPRMISTAGVIELEYRAKKAPLRERLPVPQIGQKGGSDCGEVMDARL
ncbi:hypothetical protein KVT40_002833 [Elsinoe batatas]|uniref:Uncharacterized protein n=1 Tax=Elsinoe batatas TaxID=2601811 RepID=A0A8K0L6D2_9PEZI|nr:hypothetical protein KVT40_002833 [Elsinoe batatas]